MREKYESLAISDLRALAKIRGIKGASSMSKATIVDKMVELDDLEAAAKEKEAVSSEKVEAAEKKEPTRKKRIIVKNNADKPEEKASSETASAKENTEKETVKETVKEEKKAVGRRKIVTPEPKEENKTEAPLSVKADNTEQAATVEPAKESNEQTESKPEKKEDRPNLDSGIPAHGILEVMSEGYGFIRCDNFLPGVDDVYVAPGIIRRFGLRTGDIIDGSTRIKTQNEKFSALLSLGAVNGFFPEIISKRVCFEDMTPIFPDHRINLETPGASVAMRVMDLLSPVGKGQRGMIVSPPKAGKTTLLKEVAKSVKRNNPEIHLIILLIDERPEEVTDIKEAIEGPNVEVIYSTFDELPEHHKRVSEMVIERAKRLVEHHKDVMILLDSITRLTRAYNLTVPPSGRTLSGGLDPAALHMPKRFFGAARNMREGGSLTILATALVETGSKMDDVVYEEFKGTGNMEMVLDRKLSEKRIFPAIDIAKSGTRRDDLLLTKEEIDAVNTLRKGINGLKPEESVDRILDMFAKTRGNNDFIHMVNKIQLF